MLVSEYERTVHVRPPHASTVGAPVPAEKPLPVSVSVALAAAAKGATEVRYAVCGAARLKEHGRLLPLVESEAGSAYRLAWPSAAPHSWLPSAASSAEHVAEHM